MFWRRLYISLWGNHSITTLTVNFWQWYFFFRNVANHFFFFFPSWIGTIHVCWFAKLHLFGAVLEYEPLCFQCRWVGDSFCTDTIKVVFIICGWRHCLYPMLYSLLFNNPCRVFFSLFSNLDTSVCTNVAMVAGCASENFYSIIFLVMLS